MAMFVVEYTYTPESSAGRDDHRTDHRAWLTELVRRKIVRSSGPLADHSGAMFIVQAADADAVARLFSHDPFARADLVEDIRVSEWSPAMGDFSG
ncbi:YciI family protein [Rhodococcoides yunnanense]|uniref:YciI family protein n=1 Tax=Rhodococcoides yunnanense TaxID=278209 RepID=UPI000934C6E0|nr:YciI family protein [Rhodococcus yunnanensis]